MAHKTKKSEQQRALNSIKRNIWTRNPVTKAKPSGKLYNRQKFHSVND